ncbi:dynamin family protein [Bacillus niameyensis]|uniref:dynamin family protein n=1 Tax=Bacillus niameyensis TaxID=1522308 RepID=UPI000783D10E|nr:dynamin family protein [Bacillus niameyensis]
MDQVVLSSIKEQYLFKALTLLERFQQHQDNVRVNKSKKLIKKIYNNDCIIAFSGHFSAGKSTMINTLIGDTILPTSPIPTSANLVRIRSANQDYAKIYQNSKKPLLLNASYDFNVIKELCKQEEVLEVEIGREDLELPENVWIMDTPGIDSTDDAHRLSTESALHLADLVFYVMDYNHVQSELNFTYTKNMLEHGVKLYLIINQIDKHNESELSFHAFKESVAGSFASWGVEPAGIFFTTLRNSDHIENELETVKMLIKDVFSHQNQWIEPSIESAFYQLSEEHDHWLKEQVERESIPYKEVLSDYSEAEILNLVKREESLKIDKNNLCDKSEEWGRHFENECERLLKNAYLMPYETRELAELFLQSIQPEFKVGIFFSKQKTEEERQNRLNAFLDNVKKQVESQLNWHIRQWLSSLLSDLDTMDENLQLQAQNVDIHIEADLLLDTVKRGAGVNGQSVLNYCEDVSREIKKIARSTLSPFKEQIIAQMEKSIALEIADFNAQILQISEAVEAMENLDCIQQQYDKRREELLLPTGGEEAILSSLLLEWEQSELLEISSDLICEVQKEKVIVDKPLQHSSIEKRVETEIDGVIDKVEKAIFYLQKDKHFKRLTLQLEEKVARLKNRHYTIALFGAFSAGKSSFANALLGQGVLPVSPNPTTAAINRICPISEVNPHGSAVIHFKGEKEMLSDLNNALLAFDRKCLSLEDGFRQIPSLLTSEKGKEREKVQLSFLNAFSKGYPNLKTLVGQSINTTLEGFKQYVGDEVQSCFVESIDLYYDCSLTRQGITLVDTPGADSINARHTGVAFDYIKNADAIIFVTYYNHAFSRADREFLIQLGRVKDTFELDKMFFIVNAIDLASSENEITEVLDYVEEELGKNGITKPKLFGLSSKLALTKNQQDSSKIGQFHNEFQQFLRFDLSKLTIQAVEAEYDRALLMLEQLIESASGDKELRANRRGILVESKDIVIKSLSKIVPDLLVKQLVQEAEELTFYVKQRVFYRFSDFFKESFNPAVLKGNHREQLKACLTELIDALSYDLGQELRATSLRLEKYSRKQLISYHSQIEKDMQRMKAEIKFSHFENSSFQVPTISKAFEKINRKPFENQFKYFRNPRAFFELDEKKKMEEAYRNLLSPLVDEYLMAEHSKVSKYYQEMLETEFERMKDQIEKDLEEQYDAWISSLSDDHKLPEWIQLQSILRTF